jgi:hypothetical protein
VLPNSAISAEATIASAAAGPSARRHDSRARDQPSAGERAHKHEEHEGRAEFGPRIRAREQRNGENRDRPAPVPAPDGERAPARQNGGGEVHRKRADVDHARRQNQETGDERDRPRRPGGAHQDIKGGGQHERQCRHIEVVEVHRIGEYFRPQEVPSQIKGACLRVERMLAGKVEAAHQIARLIV